MCVHFQRSGYAIVQDRPSPRLCDEYQHHVIDHVARKHDFAVCDQQRRRSVCASAQSNPCPWYKVELLNMLQAEFQYACYPLMGGSRGVGQ